jgi:ribokinase
MSCAELQKPIVIIGSINMDLVARTTRRPQPGETLLGRDFATLHGGKGANQAVAAARLGGKVHLVGRVGDDAFGHDMLDGFKTDGVGIDYVSITPNTSSGVAMIVVDDTGENSIIVIPGANARLTPADIDAAEPIIAGAACVLLQLETPYETIEHAIKLCQRLGVYTILDPAPAPAVMPAAFYRVDLLTPNQAEARTLVGASNCADDDISVGRELLKRGARNIVLKLGSKGAMLLDGDGATTLVPAFAIKAVDTTAAGDAFNAGLAVGLSEQMTLADALGLASAAGALACTRRGAQLSLPTRDEAESLMNE